jgi:serine/threonine protein kinase
MVDPSLVDLVSRLSENSLFTLYNGLERLTKGDVAVLAFREPLIGSTQYEFVRTMEIWTGVRHPAVIRVLGYSFVPSLFTSERGPVVVAELMQQGTLEDVLGSSRRGRTRRFWTGTAQSKFVFGIASALAAFHAEGIVYGGLTTGKVFIGDNFEPIVGLSQCSGFGGDKRVPRRHGPNFFVAP